MMLNQMAGLFVLLVTGFLLNRLHILSKEAEGVLSKVAAKVLLPAFMLYTFMEECTVANLAEHGNLVLFGGVFQVTGIFAAILLAKWLGKGDPFLSGVYRYALGFPNIGGFGFPTVLALFGQFGLFQYQLFMLVNHFLCYAWGVGQMQPAHERGGWREAMKKLFNPVVIGLLIGMVLGLSGLVSFVPSGIRATVQNLGNCFSPMSLLLTGFVIGDYRFSDILKEKRTYIIALLRLILIPGAFLVVLRILHVPDMICVLTCLAFACPCGMNTVVFPAAYGQDTRPGAGLTLLTSAAAVVTIPLLMSVMM
jgi:predicted permease